MDNAAKLAVLSSVAHALNARGVTWAVGGSLLLYFHGRTDVFHDIDLAVTEEDADLLSETLQTLGTLCPPQTGHRHTARRFLEFVIGGAEVDAMAGYVLEKDGRIYDCSLTAERIEGTVRVNGETIPLQRLSDWRTIYALREKPAKVRMIDEPPAFPVFFPAEG